ncbi:MAG TPA: hypothetical protein VFE62_09675 [Gemmataceae bacterium]|nr:hypothetical protein [Gemmataceae bacterium]
MERYLGVFTVVAFLVAGVMIVLFLCSLWADKVRRQKEQRKLDNAIQTVLADHPEFIAVANNLPRYARKLMRELNWKDIKFSFTLD